VKVENQLYPRKGFFLAKATQKITQHSTAEYFAKNLQQVGFSSPVKAVLTTLKEAVDNSLDACEEAEILPELEIIIKRIGAGTGKNSELVEIVVDDNGPGIEADDLPKVFGEYLSSSKFGRGRCSRGQQGIGISAAVTWAQLTNAAGVKVISKTANMRKAIRTQIDVDIKANKGIAKNKETIEWDRPHGTRVEFRIDGRVQLNGDGGLITYVEGTTLVNPHLTLRYKLLDNPEVEVKRVSELVPEIPPPTLPHPHTLKLGEFMTHAHLFGKMSLDNFLRKGFSRVSDEAIKSFVAQKLPKSYLSKSITSLTEEEFKTAFQAIQASELMNPSTRSVMTIGEESLSKSIQRLGQIDFFSVVARKPCICDHKPVAVEVAIARFVNKVNLGDEQTPVQLLRFANRVPLQFDKAACAITGAVESVNWRSYGLGQSKDSLPMGPYVFAVSVVSPFIKFKNASKETIDASDELVEEIRRALMQAGQKLSRHIKREFHAADLERKLMHMEKFGPILVQCLGKIVGAPASRLKKAEEGLAKLLGRDGREAEKELANAETQLEKVKARQKGVDQGEGSAAAAVAEPEDEITSSEQVEAAELRASAKDDGDSASPRKKK
jgi:DNA topoisomerase VI subunit B